MKRQRISKRMGHSAVPSISGQPAPQVIHRKQSMQQFHAYQQQLQLQQQQAQMQAQAQVQPPQYHNHHQHTASTASSVASSSTGHEGDSENASYNGQGSIQSMLDLYEVGEVIGTGTFGIIRKVREGGRAAHPAESRAETRLIDCLP